ncbi:Kinesin-Like Protein Kif21A [Manis pentadactyla]|nr:Kinesin-Like Protein Kif21A [Manis pentadactyla]
MKASRPWMVVVSAFPQTDPVLKEPGKRPPPRAPQRPGVRTSPSPDSRRVRQREGKPPPPPARPPPRPHPVPGWGPRGPAGLRKGRRLLIRLAGNGDEKRWKTEEKLPSQHSGKVAECHSDIARLSTWELNGATPEWCAHCLTLSEPRGVHHSLVILHHKKAWICLAASLSKGKQGTLGRPSVGTCSPGVLGRLLGESADICPQKTWLESVKFPLENNTERKQLHFPVSTPGTPSSSRRADPVFISPLSFWSLGGLLRRGVLRGWCGGPEGYRLPHRNGPVPDD